jgi:hypothetical protein
MLTNNQYQHEFQHSEISITQIGSKAAKKVKLLQFSHWKQSKKKRFLPNSQLEQFYDC